MFWRKSYYIAIENSTAKEIRLISNGILSSILGASGFNKVSIRLLDSFIKYISKKHLHSFKTERK